MQYFIDTEYDGLNGPLISLAIIGEDGSEMYLVCKDTAEHDPWVEENVIPHLYIHGCVECHTVPESSAGSFLRRFLAKDPKPVLTSDSLTDAAIFARLMSTGADGEYYPTDFPEVTFKILNVDPYENGHPKRYARHSAWCDAEMLRAKLMGDKPRHITL